ncbi:hypothetical protein M8J77_011308 [Diaphorina citri]|nr:hypothetical protein M8J77_011308 [Diaphorina citri]
MSSNQSEAAISEDNTNPYVTVISVDYQSQPIFPPEQYSDYIHHYSENNATSQMDTVNTMKSMARDPANNSNASSNSNNPNVYETFVYSTESSPLCVYLLDDTVVQINIEDAPNTTSAEIMQVMLSEKELALPTQARNVFAVWIKSGLLEVQLKPRQKPLEIYSRWQVLLARYAHASLPRQQRDQPTLSFQRNTLLQLKDEMVIKDHRILDLLYAEARHNILEGRYPCDASHYYMLGGIQARIELGSYNPSLHSSKFFRDNQDQFLPIHMRRGMIQSWFPKFSSKKTSPEVCLLEHYQKVPLNSTERKLTKKYLEFCWSLPYYGCAFFQAQIEMPVRGLTSLITHQDKPVLVGVNYNGIFLIDNQRASLLLSLRYEEFSWDLGTPAAAMQENPDCMSCIFLQFLVLENGTRVSKILQVFSKQARMIDSLIAGFVDHIKSKKTIGVNEQVDGTMVDGSATSHEDGSSQLHHAPPIISAPRLSNKLSKLTLATFDEQGRCIGKMGSWSFSY